MTAEWVVELMQRTLWMTMILGGPLLMVALVIGLAVSVIQAATQVNEMTLAFIPKVLAVGFCLWVGAGWMIRQWLTFINEIMTAASNIGTLP